MSKISYQFYCSGQHDSPLRVESASLQGSAIWKCNAKILPIREIAAYAYS